MAWQSDKLKEAHKELVDKVVKDMEEGKVFFWDSQHFGRPARNIQSKKVNGKETRGYHGKNKFILGVTAMMKGYTDSRWGTYENIKAAGGQVRKGEKATLIELWLWDKPVRHKNPRTGKWETVYQKDDKGNFVLDRQGKKIPKMIHLDSPIVKGYPVFNVEQADGLKLEPEYQVTISEADRQVKMEVIISGSEAVIYNDQTDRNYYSPVKDEIHVMKREDFKTLSGYYSTVTHEIAHSTGAENRLNRENLTKGEGFGSVSYAKEELVAEMTSMFIAQEMDLKFDESHYENHAAYLQSWISVLRDNPDVERHFNTYRTALIEMPELRQNLLRKNQGLMDEQIVENCKEANEFCSREMQKMRAEESLYLEMHPEIQALNAKRAESFLYVAKKEDFKRLPSAYILSSRGMEEAGELMVAEKPGDYHAFRTGVGLRSDEVAFESPRPISSMADRHMPVHMALDIADQVAYINMLGKLRLEVKNTGPIMEGHAPSKLVYSGISAIDELARLKQQDLEAARLVKERRFIDRKVVEQQQILLTYGGEKLAEIAFEEGCGRLTGEALGLNRAAKENPEIAVVLSCALKMKGGADSSEIRALVNDEKVEMPSYEERRDKVLAARPNSHALNKDLYNYYERAALQDLTATTKEAVMAGMVKIMEADGLRPVKIANIARTNRDFKEELLPVKAHSFTKTKGENGKKGTTKATGKSAGQKLTMEEQADRAAREATKQEQKNLLKAAAKEAQKKKLSPKESLMQGMEVEKGQGKQRELSR